MFRLNLYLAQLPVKTGLQSHERDPDDVDIPSAVSTIFFASLLKTFCLVDSSSSARNHSKASSEPSEMFQEIFGAARKRGRQIVDMEVEENRFLHVLRTCVRQSRQTYYGSNAIAKTLAAYRLPEENKYSHSLFKGMRSFALVLEINNDLGQAVVDYLRNAADKIANALEFEETRDRYVVKEANIMLQLQEEILRRFHDHDPKQKQVLVLDDQMTLDLIFQHSSLGRLLKYLFHSINEGTGVTACVVNGITRFALKPMPPQPAPPSQKNHCFIEPYQHQPAVRLPMELINSIRRYHTMVLRMDLQATKIDDLVAHLLQLHSQDGAVTNANAPQTTYLSTFITRLNPLKSFEQLHVEMGVQLRQCFEIAAHLIYWRVGMVIKTLARTNRYRVASSTRADAAYTAKTFALRFAPLDIKPFLIRIGMGLSLGEFMDGFLKQKQAPGGAKRSNANSPKNIPAKKLTEERLLQIIVFLLGTKCIEEIHTYIYLTVPYDTHAQRPSGRGGVHNSPTGEKETAETDGRPPGFLRHGNLRRARSSSPLKLPRTSSPMLSPTPSSAWAARNSKLRTRAMSSLNLNSLNKSAVPHRTADMCPLPIKHKRSSSESILTTFADMTAPPPTLSSGLVSSWLDEKKELKLKSVTRREKSYLAKHFTVQRLQKKTVGRARAKQMQKMFLRLLPYFRGTHHVEEIIWVESLREKSVKVSRKDIEKLLQVFGSVLTTVEHQSAVL